MRARLPLLLALLLVVSVSGCSGGDSLKGEEAPDFTVETVRGDTVSLSDFRGDVVVVDFMSSMCGYCYANGRVLKEIGSDRDVVILSVNFGETAASKLTRPGASVEDYMQTIGVEEESHPDWYFGTEFVGTTKNELADAYRIRTTPAIFLVDREGNVVRRDGVIGERYAEAVDELR